MKISAENQYLNYAERILNEGEERTDRTGVGTRELFGDPQIIVDLRDGFPLLTSKKVAIGAVASELVWMMRGDTNLRYLAEHDNHIWDEWPFVSYLESTGQTIPEQGSNEWKVKKADYLKQIISDDKFAAQFGELGPVYGHQWRAWQGYNGETYDQLAIAQNQIINNPDSRRIIVSAWNVAQIDEMSKSGLPPCHSLFQFNASNVADPETGKKYLDLKLYQRSADWFLGVPFNMAQYAFLLTAMAEVTGRTARKFIQAIGSGHVYNNHKDQIREQLSRREKLYEPPTFKFGRKILEISDFTPEDFTGGVKGYQYHPSIKGQVAI